MVQEASALDRSATLLLLSLLAACASFDVTEWHGTTPPVPELGIAAELDTESLTVAFPDAPGEADVVTTIAATELRRVFGAPEPGNTTLTLRIVEPPAKSWGGFCAAVNIATSCTCNVLGYPHWEHLRTVRAELELRDPSGALLASEHLEATGSGYSGFYWYYPLVRDEPDAVYHALAEATLDLIAQAAARAARRVLAP